MTQLRDLVVKASETMPNGHVAEPPRPLTRPAEPANPFPAGALGSLLGSAARAIQDRVQAPLAICGSSVLATAALATQAFADVMLPMGQARPLSLYFVTVAASGERKSSVDREALQPIEARERRLVETTKAERDEYDVRLKAWKTTQADILADKKLKGRQDKEGALRDLGPAPVAPLDPMLTAPEPTYEGICRLLATGQPSIGVFSAEGGQFIGGHGMNPENKLKTAAAMSDLWDAGRVKRLRAGDGALILHGRRVSLHLMAQPDVAALLLSDALLKDQGLLSRILVTAPDTTAGLRLWRDEHPGTELTLAAYGGALDRILATEPPKAIGPSGEPEPNELKPRLLVFRGEARRMWTHYADHVERQIAPGGELEPIRASANKLAEQAARVAGVLSLIADLAASEITAQHLEAAIELADHYAAEALRLAVAGLTDPELRVAQRLLDHLHHRWPERRVSLPDVYQRTLNAIGDKKAAGKLVGILEDHGWLARIDGGAEVMGTARRDVWEIVGKGAVA